MESLLDAMRFREELDNRQRQRFRLQKAKNKVNMRMYKKHIVKTHVQILCVLRCLHGYTKTTPRKSGKILHHRLRREPIQSSNLKFKKLENELKIHRYSSSGSYIPEIVISNNDRYSVHNICFRNDYF